ncbi:unnamed protein product [Caenorhabditis auriculariae]|uniref:Uncharacterized protein n=1 Tax=Caenorhabditis auriculariae TaxID=2777116 RepID=A0A8S1HTK7_9PELO|nr:unnamed protein product [Caenorhabditis auriculariae]
MARCVAVSNLHPTKNYLRETTCFNSKRGKSLRVGCNGKSVVTVKLRRYLVWNGSMCCGRGAFLSNQHPTEIDFRVGASLSSERGKSLRISSTIVAIRHRGWHWNIVALLILFNVSWYEILISRVITATYQFSWQEQPSNLPEVFETYIISDDETSNYWPLAFAGYLRLRYMLLMCWMLPCLAVERTCATIFIKDYEQRERHYISFFTFLICEIAATICALLMSFMILNVNTLSSAAFCGNFFVFVIPNFRCPNQYLRNASLAQDLRPSDAELYSTISVPKSLLEYCNRTETHYRPAN